MAGYIRQSRPDITNGADITAPPLNAEFDQIETAFGTAGHTHDGTAGNAPKIDLATSVSGYLKQVNGGVGGANNTTATSNPTITDDTIAGYAKGSLWLNTTTNRIYVCVSDTASAAAWYEITATNTANNVLPSGDGVVDLGAVGNRFADLLMSGDATIGGSITVSAASSFQNNVDVTGTLSVGGDLTVDSNTTVTGNTTLNGNTTIGNSNTDTVAVNAQVSTNIVPNSDDARDLGEATKEFRNLFLDGTAHIDTLNVDESATVAVDLTVGGNVQIDTNLDVDGVTTLNGNTTIGDANTDVLYVNSEIATSLVPSATNLRDLGTATKEFRDLYLDGTAHIDTLDVDENATVSGTLGVTGNTTLTGTLTTGGITGTSASFSGNIGVTGTAAIATVDINGGNIDGTKIGVSNPDTARFTTVEASGLATLTSVDINAGNIDGTVIGATAPDAATFTTVTANNGLTGDLSGNVTATTGTSNFDNITAAGTISGNVTGDLTGNVTASTGSSTFNDVIINGTLNMDAGTVATITNLSTPVNPGDAASKGYVDAEVAALVDAAPGTLDTLNELAAALNDDPNFSTTITNSIATKLPLDGGTMSGAIDMGANKVTNASDPTAAQDLSTKAYVDQQDSLQVSKSGDSMSGDLAMGSNNITGLAEPTADDHAATKAYADNILGSSTAASASAAAAATSETNAASSAAAAAGSASTADAAKLDALNALDEFTDIYLGAKSSGPTTDNDGDALDTGAIYYNTSDNQLYVWDGVNWDQAAFSLGSSIANIIEDTTPQLGGNLDLNTNTINGTGNINITGTITSSGAITGNLTGNADTATALQTARTIALGGDLNGSAAFDGTGDITITASVLDSDKLGNQSPSYYLDWGNTTNKPDPTLTLNGDVSGSATFTDLGNATLTVTVADDSHNHIIANVDGLQTALDSKLSTSGKAADSNLLDGIDSGSFLRSDTADSFSGTQTFTTNGGVMFRSGGDGSSDTTLVRMNGNATTNDNSDYGFTIKYMGSRSGNDNSFSIFSDNATSATQIEAFRINQDGTLLNNGSTIWTSGNDGSGSGLDADNLDGYTWTSSGKNVRATEFYADNWFRNYNAGEGLYNEATGVHIYSAASDNVTIKDSGNNIELELQTNGGTRRGTLYANSSNEVGILDSDNHWAIKHVRDSRTEFFINNSEKMQLDGSNLTVHHGSIVLGGTGRIQGVDTVSSGTDAANKNYVDNQIAAAGVSYASIVAFEY